METFKDIKDFHYKHINYRLRNCHSNTNQLKIIMEKKVVFGECALEPENGKKHVMVIPIPIFKSLIAYFLGNSIFISNLLVPKDKNLA